VYVRRGNKTGNSVYFGELACTGNAKNMQYLFGCMEQAFSLSQTHRVSYAVFMTLVHHTFWYYLDHQHDGISTCHLLPFSLF